jgi:hypothetical protein
VSSVRRLYVTSAGFAIAAAACLLVGLLRRHAVQDAVGSIEGAYFNRSVGHPRDVAAFSGDMFHPLHPLNAYLWIGAAAAFAVAGVVVLVVARLSKS